MVEIQRDALNFTGDQCNAQKSKWNLSEIINMTIDVCAYLQEQCQNFEFIFLASFKMA